MPPWPVLLPCVLILAFSLPTLVSLHVRYLEDADYSHGHLVLLLTVVLVVLEGRRNPVFFLRPSWTGFACVLVFLAASLFGLASTAMLIAQAALPILWIGTLWAVAGDEFARRFALPLSFAWFAMPIWDVFLEPLRQLTILVVTGGLHAFDMPAFIEGNLVFVPTGTFEIQGGCAGLRYALVAVTLAVFSNLLNRRSVGASALLTGAALLLALIGNWLRVFLTVAAGLSPEGLIPRLIADYHTAFGWIVFVIFMIPVFYLDRVLQPRPTADSRERVATEWRRAPGRNGLVYMSSLVLVVAIALNIRVVVGRTSEVPTQSETLAAAEVAGWQRSGEWVDGRVPYFVGAPAYASAWYSDGSAEVGVYAAHFASQSQGHEVVHTHMRLEGQNAIVVASRGVATPVESGAGIAFMEIEVQDRDGGRRLIWAGFRVGGSYTASRLSAKLLQVLGVLRGRHDAQALVLTAVCDSDCGQAQASLAKFSAAAAQLYDDIASQPAAR